MFYKLTDAKGQTCGGCQWGEGVRNTANGEGNELCSKDVIHYYSDPLIAVFANPIHGRFDPETMQLWEFEPDGEIAGDALKKGCKSGRTVRQIPIPVITTEQRVEIAIRCSLLVYSEPNYVKWANMWLDGTDRSGSASDSAARSAWSAEAAARLAVWAAESAAWSAARSAAMWAAWSAAESTWATRATNILDIIKSVVNPEQEDK